MSRANRTSAASPPVATAGLPQGFRFADTTLGRCASLATCATLKGPIWDALVGELPVTEVNEFSHCYPLELLADLFEAVKSHLENADKSDDPGVAEFLQVLREQGKKNGQIFEDRRTAGAVEMRDLKRLFPAGCEAWVPSRRMAGVVLSVETHQTSMGPVIALRLETIHAMRGVPETGECEINLPGFKGLQPLAAIAIQPLSAEEKDRLQRRGARFVACCASGTYLSYAGQLRQPSRWEERIFRADGRVVIDAPSFQRNDPQVWRNALHASGMSLDSEHDAPVPLMGVLSPTQHWRCVPHLYGFSLAAKRWGMVEIEGLSPIAWRDDAFDRLVMPAAEKELVHALVKHNQGGFSDVIDGKGGGCIFLLHGEPGQGKTMLAEAVAESLHRPLYSVSIGELGTSPDHLETRLRSILDVATVWDAVILLDEADIFLEARDEKDIDRNAMVGVFLRLLEYHGGVLFLTTNRVRQIDQAFYSRISVALRFPPADRDKRIKVWTSLLGAAGLESSWAEGLAEHALNGRQIKNAIRLGQTLARAASRAVVHADLTRAVGVALRFEREMAVGHHVPLWRRLWNAWSAEA